MSQTTVKNTKAVNLCDWVIKICLFVIVALVPLFFLPYTVDVLEFSKQSLMLVLVLVALVAWLGKIIAKGQFEIRKNILNIAIGVFVVILLLSSYFSLNKYQSFVGLSGNQSMSFITIIGFVLFYFIAVNNLDTIKKIKHLLLAGLISGFLVGFHGLLQLFGKFILPSATTQSRIFNLIGTYNTFGLFCAVILTIAIAYLLSLYGSKGQKIKDSLSQIILSVFLWLLAALMLFNVILIDFWVIWVGLIIAMILILGFAFTRAQDLNTKWLMLPMIILVASVLFQFINLPASVQMPAEVTPSYKSSWIITKGALQEDPLLGSGPGTFIYDYAEYRPESINNTIFWNVKFDRAISQVMTQVSTTGVLGLVSWLILFGVFAYFVVSRFMKAKTNSNWILGVGLLSSWAVLFIAKFLYSSNLTLDFFNWFLFAILTVFLVSQADIKKISFETSPKTGLLLSFAFIIVVTMSAAGLYLIGQRFAAEAYYYSGLKAANVEDNFIEVNKKISKAANLNKFKDDYYRSLTQLYQNEIEVQANKLSSAAEDEQAGITRNIQLLTDGAVNVGKKTTEINPVNVNNWLVLGRLYYNISSYVQGAEDFAKDSFDKAIELEPASAIHYTERAKTYLMKYDRKQLEKQVEGADTVALEEEAKEFLQLAVENLEKAIELKPNYAPAHYQMAIVHVRKGDLEQAIEELEVNFSINPKDVGNLFQLGLLYYQNEEVEKAQAALEQAVKLSENYSNARWYLASVYEEQGEIDKAIEQIEKVLELNPENELVEEKLNALRTGTSTTTSTLPQPVETPETVQPSVRPATTDTQPETQPE